MHTHERKRLIDRQMDNSIALLQLRMRVQGHYYSALVERFRVDRQKSPVQGSISSQLPCTPT